MKTVGRRLKARWARFWMKFAGIGPVGRLATRLAQVFTPPFYGRIALAAFSKRGYISPRAIIFHRALQTGAHAFIGDNVVIYQDSRGGSIEIGDGAHIHRDSILQTGEGGSIVIGGHSYLQPRCQLSAYKGTIRIGSGVEIAPNCAFYPYDHGLDPDLPVGKQPLQTRGGIVIEDDVWLGVGVIVLDGVRIHKGAIIGAGSVVNSDIPQNAVAVGVPARVIKTRQEFVTEKQKASPRATNDG